MTMHEAIAAGAGLRRTAGLVVLLAMAPPPQAAAADDEWRAYGGTNASLKYSSLEQIDRDTVGNLRIVWRQSATPLEVRQGRADAPVPFNYQNTPLMVGGRLYMSTGYGTVAALDAATGAVLWFDVPPRIEGEEPARGAASRGVAYWTAGRPARIIAVSGHYLVALDPESGSRFDSFGDGGQVDLRQYEDFVVQSYTWRSPPLVVGDVIVVGSTPRNARGRQPPGDIRGYDVRTGELLWTFHTPPRSGEFGTHTWLNDSWGISGFTNAWSTLSADDKLGYVYLPLKQSTGYSYGGSRPGANLFANTLLCLDAATGERVWHYQTVHHDMWDYDLPAGPALVDITVDGRAIKAVAQVSKVGFVWVFDRVTGEPVWPIEERPVPAGDIPGEWYSPTQPFPTRPPAYEQQGVTIDDLIDFTPELRQEAIAIISRYRYGPLFTPLSAAEPAPDGPRGTIQMPGTVGTTFTGAGVDPETGVLYVPSNHSPIVIEMVETESGAWDSRRGTAHYGDHLEGPRGLPIFKPPYGRLTAIDLNAGEILWAAPNGDGPRDHPAIAHLDLPPLGQPGRAAPLVTKTMVFLGEGGTAGVPLLPKYGGGRMFRAYDKATGEVIWEMELPGGATGAPMTYMLDGRQFIVVAAGWHEMPGELIALALP